VINNLLKCVVNFSSNEVSSVSIASDQIISYVPKTSFIMHAISLNYQQTAFSMIMLSRMIIS